MLEFSRYIFSIINLAYLICMNNLENQVSQESYTETIHAFECQHDKYSRNVHVDVYFEVLRVWLVLYVVKY